MAKYKINEVSKILDIPTDSIRYYENLGIITPERDPNNGYRYFSTADLNLLLTYKKYRSNEFSIKDIENIMHHYEMSDYIDIMEARLREVKEKVAWYSALQKKMEGYVARIRDLPNYLGRFTIIEQDPFYYFIYSKNGKYVPASFFGELYKHWRDYYVFIQDIRLLDNRFLKAYGEQKRGFMLRKKWSDLLSISVESEKILFCDKRKAIYTIIEAKDKEQYSEQIYNIAKQVRASGYEIAGDIMTGSLVKTHVDQTLYGYYEAWVPIVVNV